MLAITSPVGGPSRYGKKYPSGLSAPGFAERSHDEWSSLRYVRGLLPDEPVAHCSMFLGRKAEGVVTVRRRVSADGHASAWYSGLQLCNSVWTCPICSRRISEHRARELGDTVREAEARGCVVALVTLTFAHTAGEALRDNLQRFGQALSRSRSGRGWHAIKARFSPLGYVRALEVTHGDNGWHPHAHELWFLPPGTDAAAFAAAYREQWSQALDHAGITGNDHAFRFDQARGSIAQYVAKYGREPRWGVGRELAKNAHKRGRGSHLTPWQLLSLARDGDAVALALFLDYVAAFKGRRQLQWSPGLRAAFALPEPVTDDAAAVSEPDGAEDVCQITDDEWWVVRLHRAESDVLAIAARGSGEDVLRYVRALPPLYVVDLDAVRSARSAREAALVARIDSRM